MNTTTRALLLYTKSDVWETGHWTEINEKVLKPIYGSSLEAKHVFQLVLMVYQQACEDPRFEIPDRHRWVEKLALAPIDSFYSVVPSWDGSNSPEHTVPIGSVFAAQIQYMLGNLRLARVDWCNSELFGDSAT